MVDDARVRILIIDHTIEFRNILKSALSQLNQVHIVGHAASLTEAYVKIKSLRPDLVLFDFEMPGTDIHDTINSFKKIDPDLEIILTSKTYRTETNSSIRALDLGALYFLKKPLENTAEENIIYYKKYLGPVINLYVINRSTREVRNKKRPPIFPRNFSKPPSDISRVSGLPTYQIMAVGSSLGGPEALGRFIPQLPGNFPLPIVIVQHMPEGFTSLLAEKLDDHSPLVVREAKQGEPVKRGYVYLAPGGMHMEIKPSAPGQIDKYRIHLNENPTENGCRPAVDVLFRSLANLPGGNILAVILTGMGSDGLKGLRIIKEKKKCFCITQDEKSCVVYGMPAAIDAAGLSDLTLPIEKMAEGVSKIVQGKIETINKIS